MLVSTARLSMHVLDEGSPRAGRAPLVLLHPFPLSADAFRDQVSTLSTGGRVVAPSMRGFGGTQPFDAAAPPSVEVMADDVAALLDALGVTEPALIGGLSMGGYVALAFARRHRARLAALVLADTRAEPDDAAGKAARDQGVARVEAGDLAGLLDGLLPKLLSPRTFAERAAVVERVRSLMAHAAPEAVANALRALRDRPDARPELGSIAVPTLVVVGADDTLTPPSTARAMTDAIPRAELAVLEGLGHLSNLEDGATFSATLLDFLARAGLR